MPSRHLAFENLPRIGVERALGDVAIDLHFGIEISLAENSPLALLDVARPPGRVEMMQGAKAALHIHPRSHFFSGADEDADPAGVDSVEEIHFDEVAVAVMNEGDFVFGNAGGDEPRTHSLIDIETVRMGRGQIAEKAGPSASPNSARLLAIDDRRLPAA